MLEAMIRPTETRKFDVEGATLAELEQRLLEAAGDGWDLTQMRVSKPKNADVLVAGGAARPAQTRTITAATREQLDAAVPEGWQMLYVRRTD